MGSEKTEPGAMSCVNDLMSAVAPGEENLEVMKALQNSTIKFITVRQEQTVPVIIDCPVDYDEDEK